MQIDVAQSNALDVYRLLISVVTPRPIAWVTSVDTEGRVNLAPFSFFNVFGADPPVVVFAPNRKRDGSKKDTLHNVEAIGAVRGQCGGRRAGKRGQFVIGRAAGR